MAAVTEAFARWAAEAKPDWPQLAWDRAKDATADIIACMVAGAGDEAAAAVRKTVLPWGSGPATVFGAAGGAPAPWAALANGTAAHALDYDDNFTPATTHATAVLMPALLALAETIGAGGRRVLEAYIVGAEVQARISEGVNRAHYDGGWHATSTIGAIGTAAGCGRLLGLDAGRMKHAIGLAVSMAGGMKSQFGSMAKPFHAGMAAKAAVLAAELAANGLTAGKEPLDAPLGFRRLMAGENTNGWDKALAEIANPLRLVSHGLSPKRHPCCGSAHRTVDGLLDLMAEHGFGAGDVAGIETVVPFGNARNLMYDNPQDEMQARFSMPYCVAVALRFGRLSLSDFTPAAVQRPELRALMPLVKTVGLPRDDSQTDPDKRAPATLAVRLKDGRVLKNETHHAVGTRHRPFTPADVEAKLQDCLQGFVSEADYQGVRAALARFETLAHVSELTRHLRFAAGADRGDRFARRLKAAE
ncbi:MAG: MmgE/PrpD family protein [Alphaproteobacteria bacterium]|nr:MmgE/PrpD family protein [Alphaproteobacteria bacterium]